MTQERGNKKLKNMDRVLGIPLVKALGKVKHLRPEHIPALPYQRIGLLKTAAIGDTVLLTAIIRDIRESFPQAQVLLFTGQSNYEFARQFSGADEVIRLPLGAKDIPQAIKLLRDKKLDILLDFGAWPRINSVLSFFSGAGWTVGFRTAGQERDATYHEVVDHRKDQHELENYRTLVRRAGVKTGALPQLAHLQPIERSGQRPYLVFHAWPGGERSELKQWPMLYWIELAREMTKQGYNIYFTGALEDKYKTGALIAQGVVEDLHQVYNATGTSLSQTINLLREAEVLVSVNTGIMHIGAALGIRVVGLNGPTSVQRWGAYSPYAINVSPDLPGCGYLNLGFEYPAQPPKCMENISVAQVKESVEQALNLTTAQETL